MIRYTIPTHVGTEEQYILEAIQNNKISGDGPFSHKCHKWLEEHTKTSKALLTTSCTDALEMSAILSDVQVGDEVIMPSFTFVSTADAFVNRGAKVVFVDIRPDTLNMDENLIEDAITDKTKVIVPVHYAGVGCEMDTIMDIAGRHQLKVVEDAAQCMCATYKGRALGTIGDFGCYSFHDTKNFTMGEGGAILLRDSKNIALAEIIREKGTNRSQFFRGEIDKYSWVEAGSSYLPSDMNAAYLWAQLERFEEVNSNRLMLWNRYYNQLKVLEEQELIVLPYIPEECQHNGHIFYIKTSSLQERSSLIDYLRQKDIFAVFHYVPLHTSQAGMKYGRFVGEDRYTTSESDRLVRLPLYYGLKETEVDYVVEAVKAFYAGC